MKKKVEIEIDVCDFCSDSNNRIETHCSICQRAVCNICVYPFGTYYQPWPNQKHLFFCNDCLMDPKYKYIEHFLMELARLNREKKEFIDQNMIEQNKLLSEIKTKYFGGFFYPYYR